MDTPRSNLGDATYLGANPPDFDMTQEPSFQSPSKDNNLLQQLRNGRSVNLRTPRGNRAPFGERRNLPAGIGGAEFTPMLKSATRNSARKRGKENSGGLTTPGLGKIEEDMDMTNVPVETSLFGPSRHLSYVDSTPLPEVDASSTSSTPMLMPRRGGNDKGPLQDGNQLSLREQENVIDKIEKENFGLKLKIHFLEEALSKAGPGFSEAALKENTELKVDKVTMQRELSKYKKSLASVEKDLETYQQQILEVQEKAKKKYADQSQKAENDALRRQLQDKDAEIEDLQRELQQKSQDDGKTDQLRDEIGDLEADLREKDRELNERDDELDDLNAKFQEMEDKYKATEEKVAELEQLKSRPDPNAGRLSELQRKVQELEADLREKDRELNEREDELDDLNAKLQEAEDKCRTAEDKATELEQFKNRPDPNSARVSELQNKVQDLEADLREKDREINERDDELDDLRTDLKKMEDARNVAEQTMEDFKLHQSRADANAGTIIELQQRVNSLEADLNTMEHTANDRESEIDGLRSSLKTAEKIIADFKQQQSQIISDFQQQKSRADANVGTVQDLQDKINDLEADLRDMDRTVNERENEIDGLKTSLRTAEKIIADFKQQESHIMTDFKQQQSRADANASTVQGLQNKINDLEAGLRDLNRTANEREREINSLKRDLRISEQKVADLDADLRDMDRTVKDRETEIDSLKREVRIAEQKVADLDADQREMNRTVKDREREVDGLQRQLRTAEQNLADLEKIRTRPDEKTGTIRELQQKVHGLEASLLTKDREAEEREDEIDDLQTKLALAEEKRQTAENKATDFKQHQLRADASAGRITALQDKVRELQKNIHSLEDDIRTRDAEAQEREDEIDELLTKLADTEEKLQAAEEKTVNVKQQHQSRADATADQIADLQERIRELEADLATTEKQRQTAEERINDLRKRQSQVDATATEVAALEEQVQSLEDEVEVLQTLLEQSEDTIEELQGFEKLCKELRHKLDRARNERTNYKASAEKLQYDCDRLKKGAEDALAWIQAKNAEKSVSIAPGPIAPGPIKRATMATFRYGDVVMDVVDQKDHEAVIRAADSAQRRHEKEIQGMMLQASWLHARWEREARLRRDGGHAKKYLQLRLDVADACNKADLRILNQIHQDLGMKTPAQLLAKRQPARKPVNNLKVFVALIRAVARMRIHAKKWAAHEKTRVRLAEAWAEQILH